MEESVEKPQERENPRYSFKIFFKNVLFALLVLSLGYLHYKYVSYLFENDRNFSYLSDLEREMSFRTEMGFYYSYYKTVVEEKPFIAGISKLMYDKTVEYPKEVNAFNRFNIHPEVIIGGLYRYFEPWINNTAYKECHMVDRGSHREPVESCVGLGHPVFFYLEAIWVFAGINVAALFLHALELSESFLGGFLAVAQYFANHAECTRVQWAPNERENWAGPLLLLQAWLLTVQLRDRKKNMIQLQIAIFMLNCLCLLFWQFTQFIFLTQIAIFFVMEQLKIIDTQHLSMFLHSHYCGLHTAILLLQGNDMLKSSLYASMFLVVSAYCLLFSGLRVKVENRTDFLIESWLVLVRIWTVICGSVYLKKFISDYLEVEEDRHVWEILYSKISNFKSFHTLMYTCSEVFDFLPLKSIQNMTDSFLIPYVGFSIINVLYFWIWNREKETDGADGEEKVGVVDDEDSGIDNSSDMKVKKRGDLDIIDKEVRTDKRGLTDKCINFLRNLNIDAAIFYNISQMVVYGVMAALVMRLKLLFTTQLCLLSSLVFKKRYYIYPKRMMKYLKLVMMLGAVPMLRSLLQNMAHEVSHIGEFSDYYQEELLQWVKQQEPGAFAGSMPILSAIMLSTRRPIVAHPHYEHLEARQRAYAVYKVYGRFPPQELYLELNKLRASYLIVENKYCYGRSSKGCALSDIWDAVAPAHSHRPPACRALLASAGGAGGAGAGGTGGADHFYPVFRNAHYAVFRVHDFGVRYMPRSFDT